MNTRDTIRAEFAARFPPLGMPRPQNAPTLPRWRDPLLARPVSRLDSRPYAGLVWRGKLPFPQLLRDALAKQGPLIIQPMAHDPAALPRCCSTPGLCNHDEQAQNAPRSQPAPEYAGPLNWSNPDKLGRWWRE